LEHILAQALPVGLRAGGMMTFAPFFGGDAVPNRVKAGFTIVLTALLYGISPAPNVPLTLAYWVRTVLSEAVIGLAIGLSVQLTFEGMQIAGQIAGAQLGFSLASIIDPQTNIETPVLSIFHQMIALLLFLQLNVHHWLIRTVAKSFEYLPVGTNLVSLMSVRELFRAAGGMWLLGVQIAAPVLLATMLVDITVGFLNKASPQLPAMLVGISVKNLTGYVVLAASIALWPSLLEKHFADAVGWTERLLHLVR
jgi:flagellar biosynthetic protein FliR